MVKSGGCTGIYGDGRRPGPALCLIAVMVLLAGCYNRLTPPEAPENPVTIHLIDHGRHATLVLPADSTGWVRYAHGEWRWYAGLEQGLLRGLQSLFWPTRSALGRQYLESLPSHHGASAAIPEGYRAHYSFAVDNARVKALREQLDAHFNGPVETVYQPAFNLYFVPYPRSYWLGANSNRIMITWLRALNVRVVGPGLFSHWHLHLQEDTGFDQHGTGRTDVVCRHGRINGRGGDQLCAAE